MYTYWWKFITISVKYHIMYMTYILTDGYKQRDWSQMYFQKWLNMSFGYFVIVALILHLFIAWLKAWIRWRSCNCAYELCTSPRRSCPGAIYRESISLGAIPLTAEAIWVNLSTSNLHRRHRLEKCTEDPNHQTTPALYILWCMYQKGMQLNSGPQEVWQILVGLAAGWLGTSYHPLKRGLAAFGMELGSDGLKGRRWTDNFFSARLDLSDFQNHE